MPTKKNNNQSCKKQFIEKSKNFPRIIKMSDEELSPEEALLKRQRKEKKDLQACI